MKADGNPQSFRWTVNIRIALGVLAMLIAIFGTLIIAISASDGRIRLSDTVLAIVVLQPLSIFSFWIQAPRLALIAGAPVGVGSAFLANSISATLFNILPGRSSEILKPLVLNMRDGLPIMRGVGALVAERLLDTGCVLLMLVIAMAGNASRFVPGLDESAMLPTLALVVAVLLLFAISMRPSLFRWVVAALPSGFLERHINEFLVSMQRLGDVRSLSIPVLFTIVTWSTSYLNVIIVSRFLGEVPLDMSQALVVLLAGTLGMVVTIVPGGLGTFEAAIVTALTAYGYTVANALAIAVVLRVAMIMPALPFAAWYLAHGGMALAKRALDWRAGDQKQ